MAIFANNAYGIYKLTLATYEYETDHSIVPRVSSTPVVSSTPIVVSTPAVSSTPVVSSTPAVSSTPRASSTPAVSPPTGIQVRIISICVIKCSVLCSTS